MKTAFHCRLILCVVAGLVSIQACAAEENRRTPDVIKVWSGPVPGEAKFTPPENAYVERTSGGVTRLGLVTEPTLTLYPAPKEKANGAMVIVCPGGGYNILAWDKEGTEIAEWLNTLGVSAAVLKYRVPRRSPESPHEAPLQDAQRAIRLIRSRAAEWEIDQNRIGILGFSAGGHLTVMAATHWETAAYPKQDAIDELSARPDFAIPIYPAYLGDEDNIGPLSPLVRVTKQTPPMFIAVTQDDKLRGVNAALLYVELSRNKVPAELHIYTRGGHGYGLRPSDHPVSQWPARCADWLKQQKLLEPAAKAAGS